MLRVTVLAAHHKNPDSVAVFSVDQGAGEVVQQVNSPWLVHWCAEAWKLDQSFHDSVEVVVVY
jgi:hypothetical protein